MCELCTECGKRPVETLTAMFCKQCSEETLKELEEEIKELEKKHGKSKRIF